MADIYEWRGCSDLVLAEVLADDNATPTTQDPNHGYVAGEVFDFAGLARVNKAVESSSEAHYYNNLPCVVVTGEGPDTITLDVSAVPLDIRAKVTGQQYSTATGTMIECERKPKMWALGYKTQNTKGETIFVWRLKGSIQEGDLTNETRNNSTDANGETWTYTGISTTHKFTNMPDGVAAPAKAVNTNATLDLIADPDEYFATVQTPDTITAKA